MGLQAASHCQQVCSPGFTSLSWGWGVVSKHTPQSTFCPLQEHRAAVEKKKKRRKVRRERSSCQQWGGPGMGVCWPFLTRSPSSPHHPTRRFGLEFFFFSTSSSPLGDFQRRSEGDSTCEERKGEWEIETKQNESKSCSKLPNSFHRPGVSEKAHKFGLRS